jgi:GT2 family glycosyltransferase
VSASQGFTGLDAESGRGSHLAAVRHWPYIADRQAVASEPLASENAGHDSVQHMAAGRHVAPPPSLRGTLAQHRSRFASFSFIGVVVLVFGVAVQALAVRLGAGAYGSYALQAIFSIELSFALNRRLTWQTRNVGLWGSCLRFNVQKLLLTIPNLALYALLVRLGSGWLIANLATTAVFTAVNYMTGDIWSFATQGARRLRTTSATQVQLPMRYFLPTRGPIPTVSVVIPCKSSETTIRATVEALLAQNYPGLIEIIVVGDIGDSTWMALQGVHDRRLIILEQPKAPGKRDPNIKRDVGIRYSTGEILALADSDIVMDRDWLSKAVSMLITQGGGLVAGGMRSIHDTYWGRFVDGNILAAKTPRLSKPYYVTTENFGKRGFKPPVTANAVFTRELYRICPLDVTWAYGYEDYEWFWRLVKTGQKILFTAELTAAHHHRRSFRKLVKEYQQSAHGCAHFIRRHGDSPLARKRQLQAFGLPAAALGFLATSAIAVIAGRGEAVAAIMALALAVVGVREALRARALEALTYPPATLALGWVYTANLAGGLLRTPSNTPPYAAMPLQRKETEPRQDLRRSRNGGRICWPLLFVLILQAALSLSLVWSNTAFGDEGDYLWGGHLVIANWLHGTQLPSAITSVYSGSWEIYPPMGAAIDSAFGLAGARILSLLFMMGATILLYLTARQLIGRTAALIAAGIWSISQPVLQLAFATYDPLSIFLIALSAWAVVKASCRSHCAELIAVSAIAMALSNVTAFSSVVIDPGIIAFALCVLARQMSLSKAVARTGWLAGVTAAFYVLLMTITHSWAAAIFTVFARSSGYDSHGGVSLQPYSLIIKSIWGSTGLIVILAAVGTVVAVGKRTEISLMATTACISLIVPAAQLYDHTAVSMLKHLTYGIWFAAMAAGYGLQAIANSTTIGRRSAGVACFVALIYPGATGWQNASVDFHSWPNATRLVAALRPIAATTNGIIFVNAGDGADDIVKYYLPQGHDSDRWDPGLPTAALLKQWNISAVALYFPTSFSSSSFPPGFFLSTGNRKQQELLAVAAKVEEEPALPALTLELEHDRGYRLAAVVPYNSDVADGVFAIWQRTAKTK